MATSDRRYSPRSSPVVDHQGADVGRIAKWPVAAWSGMSATQTARVAFRGHVVWACARLPHPEVRGPRRRDHCSDNGRFLQSEPLRLFRIGIVISWLFSGSSPDRWLWRFGRRCHHYRRRDDDRGLCGPLLRLRYRLFCCRRRRRCHRRGRRGRTFRGADRRPWLYSLSCRDGDLCRRSQCSSSRARRHWLRDFGHHYGCYDCRWRC
jgi:hypothetical protein